MPWQVNDDDGKKDGNDPTEEFFVRRAELARILHAHASDTTDKVGSFGVGQAP